MAFVTQTPALASFALKQVHMSKISNVSSVSLTISHRSFPSLKARCFQVFCAANKQTVDKVCKIVRKQLALPADAVVTGESNISGLGADSLDTVETVMAFEEEFGNTVEEVDAQTISTVQEAADVIEELLKKKGA